MYKSVTNSQSSNYIKTERIDDVVAALRSIAYVPSVVQDDVPRLCLELFQAGDLQSRPGSGSWKFVEELRDDVAPRVVETTLERWRMSQQPQ